MAKQLTIFVENKSGSLKEVTKILSENKINILSFSLADSSEFGLFRTIVSDPESALKLMKDNNISASLTEVTVALLGTNHGTLYELLELLKDFSIEYLYMYANRDEIAGIVLKITEREEAEAVMENHGYKILRETLDLKSMME